jgi:hypothetical protein
LQRKERGGATTMWGGQTTSCSGDGGGQTGDEGGGGQWIKSYWPTKNLIMLLD